MSSENPYAPPNGLTDSSGKNTSGETADQELSSEPITFAGSLDDGSLRDYLKKHDNPGLGTAVATISAGLFLAGICFSVAGSLGLPIVIGMFGFLTASIAVSTVQYRRRIYLEANPLWDQPIRGRFEDNGIFFEQNGIEIYTHASLVQSVVFSGRIVALSLSLPRNHLLLLSESMFADLDANQDSWARLRPMVSSSRFHGGENRTLSAERIAGRLVASSSRNRRIGVPPSAHTIDGWLSQADYDFVPKKMRRFDRPMRAKVIRFWLLLCVLLIAFGLARTGSSGIQILLILVFLQAVAVVIRYVRESHGRPDQLPTYYIKGFVDSRGITLDFDRHCVTTHWSACTLARSSDDRIVIQRKESRRLLVLSRDLCESVTQWRRIRDLAISRLESTEHDGSESQR